MSFIYTVDPRFSELSTDSELFCFPKTYFYPESLQYWVYLAFRWPLGHQKIYEIYQSYAWKYLYSARKLKFYSSNIVPWTLFIHVYLDFCRNLQILNLPDSCIWSKIPYWSASLSGVNPPALVGLYLKSCKPSTSYHHGFAPQMV